VDRFNLQIQIASSELKLLKLGEARDGLETQIGTELLQLAKLKLQLGGRRPVSRTAQPTQPEPVSPEQAHHEITEHLTARGYAKHWTRHTDTTGGRQQLEYWTKSVSESVMLMLTRNGDGEPTDCQVFLSSHMCPAESLP
jgi:hypothetical protein